MTEEEIKEAQKLNLGYCAIHSDIREKDYGTVNYSFRQGVKWALENQWHNASKELPEDGIKVIVLTEKGNAAINSVYTFNGNRRWHSNYKVSYWMPIPSLSKELK
jgi:hypothetical protein